MDDWRWMAALGAVVAVVVFCCPLLPATPLLDPDEGLLASIAQEMAERGDWITPRLLDEPFWDKPILMTWARAASLKIFGMHEAAVRLPGLLLGLLGAATTAAVGWRMFDRGTGLLAGLFYSTLMLPTALAQAAMGDVALVPCVNLAVLLFWEADRAATRRAAMTQTAAIGLLLGLAGLAKGLTGVAVVGVAYGSYLLIARRLTVAACIRGAVALGIGVAVAAPWYVAMELRNPGYNYYYLIERHFLGFATTKQLHGDAPWWYYLPVLLAGGLPWIAYLPVAAQDGWSRWRTTRSDGCQPTTSHGATALLWCWLIGGTLFFSLAGSKLVTYIWPVFPAVAVLAAGAWIGAIRGTLGAAARQMLSATCQTSCLVGPVVLPGAMLAVQKEFSIAFSWPIWTAAILAAGTSWVPMLFWNRGRAGATVAMSVAAVAIQFAVVVFAILPPVAEQVSARGLADHFNRTGRMPAKLLIAEERIGSLIFYLDPKLRAGLHKGQLKDVRLPVLPTSGAVVAIPERRIYRAERHFDLSEVAYQRAGRFRLYDVQDLMLQHAPVD
ncbi:MAG: glycosyltransferase family 39 protein [Candidatus Nealsonbacteria bacterium]|nr:glycosyltransferase family 39 protein [Candidatus Nealsonbacteria bacterium]